MTQHELGVDDDGQTIQAAPGDQIVLRLPETPGTGYRWALAPPAPPGIELQSSAFEAAFGSQVGGGGLRTFTFTVHDPTSARIDLRRMRPWEGERSADRSFAFEIDASNPN